MTRIATWLLLLAAPGLAAPALVSPASASERAGYWAARETALTEFWAEHQRFARPVNTTTYDAQALETTGTLIRLDRSGRPNTHAVELVALFDHTAGTCTWAFDTDIYPKLARTAANAVQIRAQTRGWPTDAIQKIESSAQDCLRRTALATSIGDLDFIDQFPFGDVSVFLGFPALGENS